MNRKLERRLIMIGAIWEIITGVLTIFYYASMIKKQGLGSKEISFAQVEAVQSLFGSLYMFTVTFGMVFVCLGLVNLYIAKHLEDHRVGLKIPIWLIFIGISSYFMMDIISSLMFLSAGILALAKNKSFARIEKYDAEIS